MKWPWVSRRAYDLLENERDRLREQNDQLFEHLQRIDRVEHKLPETPRAPRRELEPMPKPVRDHIDSFADRKIQAEMRKECLHRHANGEAWEKIIADIQKKEHEDGAAGS